MQKQRRKRQKTSPKTSELKHTPKTIEDKQYPKTFNGFLKALKQDKKEKAKEILESLSEKEQDEIFKYIEKNWNKENLAKEKKEIIDSALYIIFDINKEKLRENPGGDVSASWMLWDVGKKGDISLLLKALFNGANINTKLFEGRTFIYDAIEMRHFLLIEFLAKNKYLVETINSDLRDSEGGTFLHSLFNKYSFISFDYFPLIRSLFEREDWFKLIRPILYSLDNKHRSILGVAASNNNIDFSSYLMTIGYNPLIGEVEGLEDYKQKWIDAIKESHNFEELKSNIKKQGVEVFRDELIFNLKLYFDYLNADNKQEFLRQLSHKDLSFMLEAMDVLRYIDTEYSEFDELVKYIVEINEQKLKDNPEGNEEANKMLLRAGVNGSILLFLNALMNGANINTRDVNEISILHSLAWYSHLTLIKFIAKSDHLRRRVKWNAKDSLDSTFLHNSAIMDTLPIMQFFFEDDDAFELIKSILYEYDSKGKSILGAVDNKDGHVADYLMRVGYNPFIGKVQDSEYIKYYKRKWLTALKNSTTIKELKENLKKQGITPKEELLELSLKHPDMIQMLAGNCNPILFEVIKS